PTDNRAAGPGPQPSLGIDFTADAYVPCWAVPAQCSGGRRCASATRGLRLVDDEVAFYQIEKALVERVLGNGFAAYLDQGLAAGRKRQRHRANGAHAHA